MTVYSLDILFFPNLEPVYCSMSGFNCCFLTCIQISQETGQVVWYSHLFKHFPPFVVIHTVKVRLVKPMVFPVVMHGCESWTIKKAECWRIDAFLWCWRRLLRVPWIARRFNQSIALCPVITLASWLAYRFLSGQVRWSGIPIFWIFFHFVVIHTKALA